MRAAAPAVPPEGNPPDNGGHPAGDARPPSPTLSLVPSLWQKTPPRSRRSHGNGPALGSSPGFGFLSPNRGFGPSPNRGGFSPGDFRPAESLFSGLAGHSLFSIPYLPSPQGTLANSPFNGLSLLNNPRNNLLAATAESAPSDTAATDTAATAAADAAAAAADAAATAVVANAAIPHAFPIAPLLPGVGQLPHPLLPPLLMGELEVKQSFVEHYRFNSPYPSILSDEAQTLLHDPPRPMALTAGRPLKVYAYGLTSHAWQLFGTMHAALSQMVDIQNLEGKYPLGAAEAATKLDAFRRAMENQIILVPLSLPQDLCDEAYFEENLKGQLVLFTIDDSCSISASRPAALGMFVGDAVYRNTLDPELRFAGRQDDVAIGLDANPLLAAVHVLTFLHMPTDPRKVPNTCVPTLEELVMEAGLRCTVNLDADDTGTARSTSLPPPLRLLVSDMRSGSSPQELAMTAGVLTALRRTLVNRPAFMFETEERAAFVAKLVGHVESGGFASVMAGEGGADEVRLPVAYLTAKVARKKPGRRFRHPDETRNLLRKINERVKKHVVRPYDPTLARWHFEVDGDMPRVRKRRSGASRPSAAAGKKGRRGGGRRRRDDDDDDDEESDTASERTVSM